jgi:uncharacterized protein with HEPN domain
MQPDSEDMAFLWDMLDAAQAAMQFTNGIQFEDFLANRMVRNAVERNLEIIGEAARYVSQTFRESVPEIPWRAMIALRNVLTHEYGEIRYERIWLICKEQLPVLTRQLEDAGVENPSQEEQ